MANDFNPDKLKRDLERQLINTGIPPEEASRQAAEQVDSMGIVKAMTGRCPAGQAGPMVCMFCPYGHMTECHYPRTCEEANCSHYQSELAAAGEY